MFPPGWAVQHWRQPLAGYPPFAASPTMKKVNARKGGGQIGHGPPPGRQEETIRL